MIRLENVAAGTVVCVRAQPSAHKSAIVGTHDGFIKIAVNAPADKGKANQAIAAILAEALKMPVSGIHLLSGQTSRLKKFLLSDRSPDEVEQTITRLFAG